jgi:hypothetical protein
MNFGLNSMNFRIVKRKIHFEPHRNRRISPKFRLIRSNPRTLIRGRQRANDAAAVGSLARGRKGWGD